MKPLGRKHFKSTFAKHHVKIKGKYKAWWEDVCTPNKKASRTKSKNKCSKYKNRDTSYMRHEKALMKLRVYHAN